MRATCKQGALDCPQRSPVSGPGHHLCSTPTEKRPAARSAIQNDIVHDATVTPLALPDQNSYGMSLGFVGAASMKFPHATAAFRHPPTTASPRSRARSRRPP
jgi:hypothetical protein